MGSDKRLRYNRAAMVKPCFFSVRNTVLLFFLIVLTVLLLPLYKMEYPTQIRTLVGDNLRPTPWQPFHHQPQIQGDSWWSYKRAAQVWQCTHLSCLLTWPTTHKPLIGSTRAQCPNQFQWIHEDLRPWRSQGISREVLESGKPRAAFRAIIKNGRLYIDLYYSCVQTRAMFSVWGLVQLVKRYGTLIPDVEFMFDCMDRPVIERSRYKWKLPPPLFRYCSNRGSFDIPFPDWSFWGWAETNIAPWDEEFRSIKRGSEQVKWKDRVPMAYWRGNTRVGSPARVELLKCSNSKTAQIQEQNWEEEAQKKYASSKLSDQCKHRYKVYAEGWAWSVSYKYILSCGSTVMTITSQYFDFFTRWLLPKRHIWPINPSTICPSLDFGVNWGNANPNQSESIGRKSREMMEMMSMSTVYDYMFHLLSEYSKLQRFTPTPTPTSYFVCEDSIQCLASPREKSFLKRSLHSYMEDHNPMPCSLSPPNDTLIRKWIEMQDDGLREVREMEEHSAIDSPQNRPHRL
ncbi:protein O-glucosyltransferase 1 [Amborella trichopoda]|uniref:Glycosyl transferase CAP10 domain-containing protein n=1 Tax=Amborella trichopoda TaxID=13333 RepID=U5CP57_AMBTC|nr:protein O-glucosyltransferase 1 [Amborella trichopoda]ERN14951.1 hypothetical protein AMTR_s00032p00207060 [Amborella trichopoda]|eukprot:XP_006853484.1 protein O-glucosyltransferase 1 [Amborella trichopoda]